MSLPHAQVKAEIAAAVHGARGEILDLSHRIHANPEIAYEERQASAWVAEAVARHGYAVEHPVGSLDTAVRGTLQGGRGPDGPKIGILAEYDALPGLGHGCGHNSMAASGVGAAIALAAIAPLWAGTVVFLGTPAEEFGSGKKQMIEDGLFEGLDAALLYHPCDRTHVLVSALASEDVDVTFIGRQAHAATDPWHGVNALDALVLLFSSIGLWRQQMPPTAMVHGIVKEGGTAANIIPDRAVGRFMVRSPDEVEFQQVKARFVELVQAAALATGTQSEVVFSGGASTFRHNVTIGDRFRDNMQAAGLEDQEPDVIVGSTDMGNVSHVVPTIHPEIAISEEGVPGHSIEFREAAISPLGDEITLTAATLVAQTAYDLFAEPALVEAAWREFRAT